MQCVKGLASSNLDHFRGEVVHGSTKCRAKHVGGCAPEKLDRRLQKQLEAQVAQVAETTRLAVGSEISHGNYFCTLAPE